MIAACPLSLTQANHVRYFLAHLKAIMSLLIVDNYKDGVTLR